MANVPRLPESGVGLLDDPPVKLIAADALADIRNTGRLLALSDAQILQAASLEVGREIARLETMTAAEGKAFCKELHGQLYAGSRSHVSWLRNHS